MRSLRFNHVAAFALALGAALQTATYEMAHPEDEYHGIIGNRLAVQAVRIV